MIDGTEKLGIPLKFAKRSRDTKNLAISRDFLGYSKLIFLFFVLYHFTLPGNFRYGSEIRRGIFWGINFGPVIFCFVLFFWSPRDFFGFWFLPPHSIIPVTWNPEYPLWVELSSKGRWIFHTFHPKLIYIFLIGNCVGESNEKTKPSLSRKMHLKLKIPEKHRP